ncbi:unnamed protein product [Schistosoma haematobium]|nr:unnamed protein product [Schistosoma haematobium]
MLISPQYYHKSVLHDLLSIYCLLDSSTTFFKAERYVILINLEFPRFEREEICHSIHIQKVAKKNFHLVSIILVMSS